MEKRDYRTYRKKVKIAYAGAWIMLSIAFTIGAIIGSVLTGLFLPVAAQTTPTANYPTSTEKTLTVQLCNSEGKEIVVIEDVTLTAYCNENYPHICNDGNSTVTATGTTPTVGRTVAVDPEVIPYGSEVTINGHTYIAEDCGGAVKGNRVDILFPTHNEALEFGVRQIEAIYVTK